MPLHDVFGAVPGGSIIALIIVLLGLAMVFIGKHIVKFIIFLIGGLIGASLAFILTLPHLGFSLAIIAAIAGFLILGFIAYLLMPVGASIVAGALTYFLAKPILGGIILPLILAAIVFIAVLILFDKILGVGTAFLGSILVVSGLSRFIALNIYLDLLIVIGLTAIGSVIQLRS